MAQIDHLLANTLAQQLTTAGHYPAKPIKRYPESFHTFAIVGHTTNVYKIPGYLFKMSWILPFIGCHILLNLSMLYTIVKLAISEFDVCRETEQFLKLVWQA